jgi:hypothetical protein
MKKNTWLESDLSRGHLNNFSVEGKQSNEAEKPGKDLGKLKPPVRLASLDENRENSAWQRVSGCKPGRSPRRAAQSVPHYNSRMAVDHMVPPSWEVEEFVWVPDG